MIPSPEIGEGCDEWAWNILQSRSPLGQNAGHIDEYWYEPTQERRFHQIVTKRLRCLHYSEVAFSRVGSRRCLSEAGSVMLPGCGEESLDALEKMMILEDFNLPSLAYFERRTVTYKQAAWIPRLRQASPTD